MVLAIVLPIILLAILAVVGLFVYKKLRKRTKHGYRTAEPDSPHIEMPEIGSVSPLFPSSWWIVSNTL